jgi:TPR repeat protein
VFLTMAGAAVAGSFEDGEAAYQRQDYATALQLWRPLADQGSAKAQYGLGGMYYKGQGVAQNHAEAMKWYRFAAGIRGTPPHNAISAACTIVGRAWRRTTPRLSNGTGWRRIRG